MEKQISYDEERFALQLMFNTKKSMNAFQLSYMHYVCPVLSNILVVKLQVKNMTRKVMKAIKVTRANFIPGDYPSLDLFYNQ